MPDRADQGTRRRRVLFIPEAVTLAHVARMIELARALAPQDYEVHLACPPRFLELFGPITFPVHDIVTMPTARFLDALTRVRPIWDERTLSEYVEAETALIRRLDPELVVGDLRISLAVSMRLVQKPLAMVINAYWSPYAKPRFSVPDLTMTRILRPPLADAVYQWTRPLAFALHAAPLNRVSRKHGLPAVSRDLREVFTWGDYVLYPDVPELIPTWDLPSNHHYLGPLLWSPVAPLPGWWDDLPDDVPIVYVTLGSSGQISLLDAAVQALAGLPVSVVAATAGRIDLPRLPANARVADYLPGELAAARARLVICNGGSPTTYQALSQGTPVLGLASNTDQRLNMDAVQRCGAGLSLRGLLASPRRIRRAALEILDQDSYHRSAHSLAAAIAGRDPYGNFRRLVASVLPPRGRPAETNGGAL